jgi:hypothetical protein
MKLNGMKYCTDVGGFSIQKINYKDVRPTSSKQTSDYIVWRGDSCCSCYGHYKWSKRSSTRVLNIPNEFHDFLFLVKKIFNANALMLMSSYQKFIKCGGKYCATLSAQMVC